MGDTPSIVATIASTSSDPENVIELVASDPARPYDPPVWEAELSAPADQSAWNKAVADDLLLSHGYRRTGEWWDSSRTTGYQSWTTTVDQVVVDEPQRRGSAKVLTRNLLLGFCTAAIIGIVSPGAAHAAPSCAPQDSQGISRCSDGSYQLIDERGHLLIFGPDGALQRDLDPALGPFY